MGIFVTCSSKNLLYNGGESEVFDFNPDSLLCDWMCSIVEM